MAAHGTSRPSLATFTEAADELTVSLRSVRRLVDSGDLPTVRIGPRTVRILRDDLEQYVRERRGRRELE